MQSPQDLWLEAEAIAASLPRGLWQQLSRKLQNSGAYARRRSGQGQEFWQYRPLSEGEPLARVDWRKSARGDSLLLREREDENAQALYLWCDMSGSMHYQGARSPRSKAEHAYLLGATLLHLAAAQGDVLHILGAPRVPNADMPFWLAEARAFTPQLLPAGATLFVVSDFLGIEPSHGFALHVLDPDEMDFPFTGALRFEGLEDEAPHDASDAAALRTDYLAAQQALQEQLRVAAAHYHICSTAGAVADQLLALGI
jgi:uncharacterized protein (DUF58 family)